MTTSVVYTGQTGAVTNYAVPFDYLSQDHVFVSLDGVLTTAFTYLSTTLIQMDSAPTGDLRVWRTTPVSQTLVEWTDGSILLDDDMNTGHLQALYAIEELLDTAFAAELSGNWDASGLRIVNVADGIDPQDATTLSQVQALIAVVTAALAATVLEINTAYDISGMSEASPATEAIITKMVIGRPILIPADFSGAGGDVEANPAAPFIIDVQAKEPGGAYASLGTATCGTDGVWTFVTVGNTTKALVANSVIKFIAPTAVDASISGITLTIKAAQTGV